jgi:hypothetical protein
MAGLIADEAQLRVDAANLADQMATANAWLTTKLNGQGLTGGELFYVDGRLWTFTGNQVQRITEPTLNPDESD